LYHNVVVVSCVCALVLALGQFAQSNTGELRVSVSDSSGSALPGPVEIISEANQIRQTTETDSAGVALFRRLPFGSYRVAVRRGGFAEVSRLIEIRSALPTDCPVTMELAGVQASVTVSADVTLLDPHQPAPAHRIGAETLARRVTALPGRTLPDLVNTQPGWLLEANGILHPRGSEYQTQYVVDGLPMTDNRSPAFAPELGADDVHAMTIMTGGYPAEYGRKLGGVIEVVTTAPSRRGFGGAASGSFGSFTTTSGDVIAEYGREKSTVSVTAGAAHTDRYLDPPVEENVTNRGSTSNASLRFERDFTPSDRFGVILRHGQAEFLVPNEHVQQDAGQRQDRNSIENAAQFSIQRILSPSTIADVRAMVRDVSAALWSNAAATPVVAFQDRGFREVYVKAALAAHAGMHELKAGVDVIAGRIREDFAYRITDPGSFANDTAPAFSFAGRHSNHEQALFVQDQMRMGAWTINAGLRWDHYALLVNDHAFSPRLAAAWSWPSADLVLRASYDRVFQTPAIENLLLASSETVEGLGDEVVRLPVPPSRGNFYEAGISKVFARRVRIDASIFSRHMGDVADDDLLLNTGVSFPIAFHRAEIHGMEMKVDLRPWNNISGALGYSYLHGVGELPVTGGLFLGEEGFEGIASEERFPLTQDQRHTVRGRAMYQFSPSTWIALAGSFGSGLPFEDFDDTPEEAVAQFGQRVVDRVNFETGRVRPSASFDVSGGLTVARWSRRAVRLQAEVRNLANRLDVINFAGLFSGTALAAPRSGAVRVRLEF
jgi:outer membrane cobalamin receptor